MKPLSTSSTVIVAAALIGLTVLIGLLALAYPKQSDYITVGGQAQAPIQADEAQVSFSVNTNAPTAQEAQDQNSAAVEKVRQALVAAGIPDGALQTSNYYLNKHTDWTQDGPVDHGYDVQHALSVTTTATNVSAVITAAVGAGANGIDRVEFIVTDAAKQDAAGRAMRDATLAAQAKAQTVAGALHTHLDRVLKVEEGNWWVVPSEQQMDESANVPAQYQGLVIAPQQLAVEGNVNVVFAVN